MNLALGCHHGQAIHHGTLYQCCPCRAGWSVVVVAMANMVTEYGLSSWCHWNGVAIQDKRKPGKTMTMMMVETTTVQAGKHEESGTIDKIVS